MGSLLIYIVKDTPLLSSIGVLELMYVATDIGQAHFRYLEPITVVGVIFLILSFILSAFMKLFERVFSVPTAGTMSRISKGEVA
jgi:polar amino acid transport system permease protein